MKRRLLLICSLCLFTAPLLIACGDDEPKGSDKPDTGVSTCTPFTQEQALARHCGTGDEQAECGTIEVDDGCGDQLSITCPSCGQGQYCDASNTCQDDDGSCVPTLTVAQAEAQECGTGAGQAECGPTTLDDGCGRPLNLHCGGCAQGQYCDASNTCQDDDGSCVPTLTMEQAQSLKCGTGNEQAECGTIIVDNGCGVFLNVNCGSCGEGLSCDSQNTCVEGCIPLNSNTAYAHYCHQPPTYWECGGPIERDDGCGGKVMVSCGGNEVNPDPCADGFACDSTTLRCVKQDCTPNEETDAAFCERYHSECGTASGKDSCGQVKTVTCSACESGELCIGSIGGSGNGTYLQQTCEAPPAASPLAACTPTQGDTSANSATSIMSLGEGFTSYSYTAPEVVYAFTAATTGPVTISATPWNDEDYDLVLYVVSSLSSRTAIKLSDSGSYGEAESLTFNATSGTTYYVVVDGGDWASHKYDRGPFQIEIDDGNCVAPTGSLVITGVYGGGGSSNAPLNQDFIELHNQGNTEVDISGWTVFVGQSLTSTVWQKRTRVVPANTKVAAGRYFLLGDSLGKTDQEIEQMSATERAKYIPRPNLEMGSAALKFGADAAKVFIAPPDVTPTGQCPTEAGLLAVYGGSYCATPHTAQLGPSNWLYDHSGCANSLIKEMVIQNGTTQKPRNGSSLANVCP
ncbi:MAG: lamin tail domain-containing protein [Myxococcales bacterium]|jgi:hypothetical protein|nr:lamin tail domain-containing protein [Myxococcales bacterium]